MTAWLCITPESRRGDPYRSSRERIPTEPRQCYNCDQEDVAPLFLLPNLKILNIAAELSGRHDVAPELDIPAGSSSIEELGIVDSWTRGYTLDQLLRAPARLKKLVLDLEEMRPPLSEIIVEQSTDALVEIIAAYVGIQYLSRFENLRVCDSVNVDGLVNNMFCDPQNTDDPVKPDEGDRFQVLDLRDFLRPTVKKIRVYIWHDWQYGRKALEEFIAMLANLVEDASYSALREVCIWELLQRIKKVDIDVESGSSPWHRLRRRGIELHIGAVGTKMLIGRKSLGGRKRSAGGSTRTSIHH